MTPLIHLFIIYGTVFIHSFIITHFVHPPTFICRSSIRCPEPHALRRGLRMHNPLCTIAEQISSRSLKNFCVCREGLGKDAMALSSSVMMALPCQSGTPLVSSSPKTSSSPNGIISPPLSSPGRFGSILKLESGRRDAVMCFARPLRPVEERFRIQVERNVDQKRKEELRVERWSKWESDCCAFDHEWKVDEQVYVVKGSVRVTPEDCEDHAYFYAGDLVRFPKWFNATLSFDEEYEQRYRFLAYGDD